jgi:hypothetical protein
MITKDVANRIFDLLIVREDDGSYILFAKYIISPTIDGLFRVSDKDDRSVYSEFSSLKYAVTWCVFNNNKKYKEVRRIQELDDLISSLDVVIAQHQKLANKYYDTDDKFIYLAKLNENRLKKKQALVELNEYILISKYWQRKKFEEHIAGKTYKNDK